MSYIIDAVRVPIGKVNGIYRHVLPEELAAFLIKSLIERNPGLEVIVQEVILANAFGTGGNMARYATLAAGLSNKVPAFTIDSQCSGGLKSIEIAHQYLQSGNLEYILAGGMESKSLSPEKKYHPNDKRGMGDTLYKIAKFSPGQTSEEPLLDAAELVALNLGVSKMELLELCLDSHKKAATATSSLILNSFISRLEAGHTDQSIKPNLTLELLKKASSEKLIDKTTSSHFNDAAAVLFLSKNDSFGGKKAIAKIRECVTVGADPHLAPAAILTALDALLLKSKINIVDIDLFEINESFAINPLLIIKNKGVSAQKVNVLGGSLAYGHAYGASGAINLLHLCVSLQTFNKKLGVVIIPAAGGLATAMLIENLKNDI